ncbi:MAG: TonB-dependent receptor plug domain-containing protein, partial [Bacteroidales bacterium]
NRSFFHSSSYVFYDCNMILHYRPTQHDNVIISTFWGNDDFTLNRASFDLKYNMEWNNRMASIQWSHYFNTRHISRTSAYYTQADLRMFIGQSNFNYRLVSTNEDFSCKHEHRFFFNTLKLKIGAQYLQQLVVPNQSQAVLNELQADFGTSNIFHVNTLSGYAEAELLLSKRMSLLAGIRENIYTHQGPYTQFERSVETGQITDTLYYASGSTVKRYFSPDMQLSLRYKLDSLSSIKFYAGRNVQFVQQVNVTTVALPTDFWLPASTQVPPLVARQLSTGYYKNWPLGFNFSVELFYKWFNPVIEFDKGLLQSISKATMEENILLGRGRSYGIEFYLAGTLERWTGWISYTLSRSERIFAVINQGQPFPSKYDRLHDMTIVLMRSLNPHWKASFNFTYASGQATTLPVGRYMVGGNIVNQYTTYNGFRMPAYHRFDVAFTRTLKTFRGINHELVFSVYNLYSRLNPYFMYYKVSGDLQRYKLTVTPQYVALFPMMPSISYRFTF